MIVTTIEQSKHLLELGLKAETCDMHYDNVQRIRMGKSSIGTPAWSLSALIELMPYSIGSCNPKMVKNDYGYFMEPNVNDDDKVYDTPLDATYEMVCWLLENGYISDLKKLTE
jgi:hypothetical protein